MISVSEAAAIAAMSGGGSAGFESCELQMETTSNKEIWFVEMVNDGTLPSAQAGQWQGLRTFNVLKGSLLLGMSGVGSITLVEGDAEITSMYGLPAAIINGDCHLKMNAN